MFTMSSTPLFLAILSYATMFWSPCDAYYKYKTERRMGAKLRYLTRELLMDVEMKVMAVHSYRDQYYKSLQYQLGDLVYDMRDHFKHMVRHYQISHRDISYGSKWTDQTIPRLVEIQRMAMEIETKVRMVQKWQYKRETKREHRVRMLSPLRSGAPRDYDDEHEPLREAAVRVRLERAARPPPRAPARAPPPAPPRRPNMKWRHITDNDFTRIL